MEPNTKPSSLLTSREKEKLVRESRDTKVKQRKAKEPRACHIELGCWEALETDGRDV